MKDKLNQPISITITAGAIFKTILILLFFYFLYVIRDVVLVLLTSIVLASAIEPGTRWFMKRKIPRTPSVIIVYLLIVAILVSIFYIFLPPLIDDIQDMSRTIPAYFQSSELAGKFEGIPAFESIYNSISQNFSGSDIITKVGQTLTGATAGVLSVASSVFGGLVSLLLIIVISFYLAVQDDGVASFLQIVSPQKNEKYVIDLWRRSQKKIGLWMQGQLLLGLIIGILTYLGLSILGVSNAMFLAVIAAVFELIPIFGSIFAAIPGIAFALIDGGVSLGLFALGLYLIIQQFESQLIHPLVVKKIVGIPALVAIIAIVIGAKVAGFLGILLSVPIAAVVMEIINDIDKKKHPTVES